MPPRKDLLDAVPNAPADARAQPLLRLQSASKEYRLYDTPRQRLRALLTGRSPA